MKMISNHRRHCSGAQAGASGRIPVGQARRSTAVEAIMPSASRLIPVRKRRPLYLLAYALCGVLLTSGCASVFRGYDPAVLAPGYRQAFREAMHVRPTKDAVDYWQTPEETRTRGKGDCEDLAFLLEDEVRKQGLNIAVEFGKAHVSNKTFHAWNEVRTADGKRVVMDAFLGVWMVDPRPGYYVKYDMAKTEHSVGFVVNELDYSIRRGDREGRTRSTASIR